MLGQVFLNLGSRRKWGASSNSWSLLFFQLAGSFQYIFLWYRHQTFCKNKN